MILSDPLPRRGRLLAAAVTVVFLLCCAAADAAEREVVPTPPGGGEGSSVVERDQALPGSGRLIERALDPRPAQDSGPVLASDAAAVPKSTDDIGGDDLLLTTTPGIRTSSMDIAADGNIYLAYQWDDPVSGYEILIRRSTDGGDTWQPWGELSDPSAGTTYEQPSVHVAEGDQDRCFIAFRKVTGGLAEIRVASSALSLTTGDFSGEIVVMSDGTHSFGAPQLTSDAVSYSSYYLYLVAHGYETAAADIFFARSVDQGATFEPAYAIASLSNTDRDYLRPTVSYGLGHYVHVAWDFSFRDDSYDSAIRYRRASNYAGGGLGAWEPTQYLTSTIDGFWDESPRVAGSAIASQVLVAYERQQPVAHVQDPGLFASSDGGATFPVSEVLTGGMWHILGLEHVPTSDTWVLSGARYGRGQQTAAAADPTAWTDLEVLTDRDYWNAYAIDYGAALDPSRGNRLAMVWPSTGVGGAPDDSLWFDAAWRDDPGYPNYEDGFPRPLAAGAVSPPALVDLNGDGRLEIVYGDDAGFIQAIRYNGSSLPGWPVAPGDPLAESPVAIGNLDGHGLYVVAGTTTGWIYAYHPDGTLADGWPFNIGQAVPVHVSIGALGGPYPRTVVAIGGGRERWLSFKGDVVPGMFGWNLYEGAPAGPAAIGDIDGDGIAEAVLGTETVVYALNMITNEMVLDHDVGEVISASPTLGDFDFDGDVEIVVPTVSGNLYLLEGDGSSFPGSWPFAADSGTRLSSGAIGQCLGTSEPEIAVAARNFQVHMVYSDGAQHSNYPVGSDGWYIYGAPIIGRVDGTSSDVVFGARGYRGWAYSNVGALIPGWPKTFADHVYETPAMGDIDLDGSNEIVFLSLGQLIVMDVNNTPNDASRTWAMFGHDPQRTGCADCPEDVVTAAEAGPDGITRVSFAQPLPTPSAGALSFSYAVPVRAQVRLEIYDLRGRRIRTIHRAEVTAGPHTVAWDGRDGDGRPLASGHYLACLQVRGPGVDQRLTRKVTVIR